MIFLQYVMIAHKPQNDITISRKACDVCYN